MYILDTIYVHLSIHAIEYICLVLICHFIECLYEREHKDEKKFYIFDSIDQIILKLERE